MEYEVYERTTVGIFKPRSIQPVWVARIKGHFAIIGEYPTEREAIEACGEYARQEAIHQVEMTLGHCPD